ncbi:MAG: rhamnulokinase, partial [Schleiferilactobacillus harbinensis]|nr:rhamnulokinase [Schleiferilactobacillus harbinensis]
MRDINLIAVDLGASSGRIVSGEFTKNGPEIKEIFRFGNRPVHIAGGLYWDYMKLFQDIKYGLNMAENEVGALASFSVDTWGVDYGLLSRYGEVVAAPHSYRDQRTTVDL